MDQLAALSKRGNEITEQNVDYAMSLVYEDQEEAMVEMDRELICHTLQGKPTRLSKKIKRDATLDAKLISGATYTEGEETKEFEVVKTKRFTVKPMSVEEAILQMNLLGHTFFVFKNQETDEMNVVYKRKDGKYAVIESIE